MTLKTLFCTGIAGAFMATQSVTAQNNIVQQDPAKKDTVFTAIEKTYRKIGFNKQNVTYTKASDMAFRTLEISGSPLVKLCQTYVDFNNDGAIDKQTELFKERIEVVRNTRNGKRIKNLEIEYNSPVLDASHAINEITFSEKTGNKARVVENYSTSQLFIDNQKKLAGNSNYTLLETGKALRQALFDICFAGIEKPAKKSAPAVK